MPITRFQKKANPVITKPMPTNRSELREAAEEMNETLEQVAELAAEALDPVLTREELVVKLKEIHEAVAEEEDEAEGE